MILNESWNNDDKKWCIHSNSAISPTGSRRAHISPEEDWNFPVKLVRMFLHYKNKASGDNFVEKRYKWASLLR